MEKLKVVNSLWVQFKGESSLLWTKIDYPQNNLTMEQKHLLILALADGMADETGLSIQEVVSLILTEINNVKEGEK